MQCPHCQYRFKEKARHCPACGCQLDEHSRELLALGRELRDNLQQLLDLKAGFNDALHSLRERVDRYESLATPLLRGTPRGVGPRETDSRPAATAATPEGSQAADGQAVGPATVSAPVESARPRNSTPHQASTSPRTSGGLEVKLGEKWLLVVGLLAMVFASGYFIKFSFEQGWVGPAGRVALAYLLGLALVGAGDHFRRQNLRSYGLYLSGGGVAVLYTASYLGYDWYQLLTQATAFGLMVMITLFTAFLALRHDAMGLAVMGLIGGFLTPVFCSSGRDAQVILMSYMAVLNLGILSLAFHKRWTPLNGLGFVCTWILFAGWCGQHFVVGKFWTTFLFLQLFYAIYTLAPLLHALLYDPFEQVRGIWIIVINSFTAFAYGFFLLHEFTRTTEWAALLTVVYAAVFLGIAAWLRRHGSAQADPFAVFTAMAGLFLVITVPLLFSRHWISVFWFAQILALGWMARRLKRPDLLQGTMLLLGIALFRFAVVDLPGVFRFDLDPVFYRSGWTHLATERLLCFAVLLLSLGGLARVMAGPQPLPGIGGMPSFYWSLFGIVLFLLLNLEVMGWTHDFLPRAYSASVSVLWSVFAISAILLGFRLRLRPLRRVAIALFVLTAGKVFFVDLGEVSTPWRILTLFVLGALLLAASYLYHRYRHLLLDTEPTTDEDLTDLGRVRAGR